MFVEDGARYRLTGVVFVMAFLTVVICHGADLTPTNDVAKGIAVMHASNREIKILPSVRTDVPGYAKVITFFTESGSPAVGGGWGHQCKFSIPNEKGVYEIEMLGLDGKPQHPATHMGLCLPFVCRDHFNKKQTLPIRLTAYPIVLSVGSAAKLGVYGQLQRVYDADGNELVLNKDPKGGYLLYLVTPDKKPLAKYCLANAHALRRCADGYAYATYSYSKEGDLMKMQKFDIDGREIK